MSRRGGISGGANYSLLTQVAQDRWWTWADAAARNATVVTAADLGKVGYQSNMGLYYRLVRQTGGVGVWWRLPWSDTWPVRQALGEFGAGLASAGLTFAFNAGGASAVNGAGTTPSTRRARSGATYGASTPGSALFWRCSTNMLPSHSGGMRLSWCVVLGPSLVADQRWFAGITSSNPSTNVDPNSLLNAIGIGRSASGENCQAYSNDGSSTGNKVDLGASFPGATVSTGFECEAYTADGTSWILQTKYLETSAETTTTFTTELPVDATWYPALYMSNNTTAGFQRFDLSHFQLAGLV